MTGGGADAPSQVACAAKMQPGLRCQWQSETGHLLALDGHCQSLTSCADEQRLQLCSQQ